MITSFPPNSVATIDRSVGQSVDRSIDRYNDRSIDRSVDLPVGLGGRAVGRSSKQKGFTFLEEQRQFCYETTLLNLIKCNNL